MIPEAEKLRNFFESFGIGDVVNPKSWDWDTQREKYVQVRTNTSGAKRELLDLQLQELANIFSKYDKKTYEYLKKILNTGISPFTLRPIVESDVNNYFENRGKDEEMIKNFHNYPKTLNEAKLQLQTYIDGESVDIKEFLDKKTTIQPHITRAIDIQGKMTGMLWVELIPIDKNTGQPQWIFGLWVNKNTREAYKGITDQACLRFFALLKEKGIHTIYANTRDFNIGAQRMNDRLGFQKIGIWDRRAEGKNISIMYKKEL